MSISNTAISILAANVKWKPCGADAVFVSDMTTGHIRAALNCCASKAPFDNNGLSHREWYDIFTAELESREGSKRREFNKLKEILKDSRQSLRYSLERYLEGVDHAIDLARDLDYQTLYLEDYKRIAIKALADLR